MKRVTLLLFMLTVAHVALASNFDEEKNNIRLTIEQVPGTKYVIEQPRAITGSEVTMWGVYLPFRVSVTNNSDKAMVISPRSFGQLTLIDAQRIGKLFVTGKGILAVVGGVLGIYAAIFGWAIGLVEYLENHNYFWCTNTNHGKRALKVGFVSTVFSALCFEYAIRKGSKPFIEEFEKKMLNDAITIEPGQKIEKLIFLDTKGYNISEFDVCLYEADNKSGVTAFHVNWH